MRKYVFLAFNPETGEMLNIDNWDFSHLKELKDEFEEKGHLQDFIGIDTNSKCEFTFAHTRHWCGYPTCRDE